MAKAAKKAAPKKAPAKKIEPIKSVVAAPEVTAPLEPVKPIEAAAPEVTAPVEPVKPKEAAAPEVTAPEAPAKPVKENKQAYEALVEALAEKMEAYLKSYPKNKTFYISSDGQVFLAANEVEAKAHQKQLDASKEVVEYLA